jgi:hypothetical protein
MATRTETRVVYVAGLVQGIVLVTGPLHDAGVSLPAIFGTAAVASILMAGLSFVIARPANQVPALHPRPA